MVKVKIPCIHNNFLIDKKTNIPQPCLKILFGVLYEDTARLVYCHDIDNENEERSEYYIPLTSTTTEPISMNPFCPHCKTNILSNFAAVGYPTHHVDSIIETLRQDAYDIIRSTKRVAQENDNILGTFVREIVRYYDMPCSSIEEVNAWVDGLLGDDGPVNRPKAAATWAVDELDRVDDVEEGDCVVCLEGLMMKKKEDDVVVKLPCQHEFHEECIVTWLRNSHVCPLCRFELPTEG
ncbi:hypothetical protein RND81_10G220100 [Saponaria officinalis]|uniref:RING-type E3 ubiquitin transferase n=1 Tax=Saponaria officinalis TaxID=3572 RepID=A0AAW1I5F3_SAPOF